MRGARRMAVPRRGNPRIIPADAGSTTLRGSTGCSCPDHPRGCGEHRAVDAPMSAEEGSSPRMRGAPLTNWISIWRQRIIPADAGSTSSDPHSHPNREDHPRGCGEHYAPNDTYSCLQGSSPRMRGALACRRVVCSAVGIIPADAGSTVICC